MATSVINTYFQRLKTQIERFRRPVTTTNVPGGPEMDPGTMNIKLPNNTNVGHVVVEEVTVNLEYIERWAITEPSQYGPAVEVEIYKHADTNWATVLAQLSDDQNAANYRLAVMNCVYQAPLTPAQIGAIPNTPSSVIRHQFRLVKVLPDNSTVDEGGLFRQVNPNNTDQWTDTWRLASNYTAPTGGATGTRLRLVPVTAVNHLREFLADFVGAGGSMVHTQYTYGSML